MKYIPPPLVRGEGGRDICQKIIEATTAPICSIPCEVKVTMVNKIDKGLALRGLYSCFLWGAGVEGKDGKHNSKYLNKIT